MKELRLRLANQEDAENIMLMYHENQETFYDNGKTVNLEMICQRIEQQDALKALYVIETLDNELIATFNLYFTFQRNRFTYLYFEIFDKFIDLYGHESLSKVINLCYDRFNLNKINVREVILNSKKIDLLKECGFIIEVCMREHFYKNGYYYDVCQLGLDRRKPIKNLSNSFNQSFINKANKDSDLYLVTNISPSKQLLHGNYIDLVPISIEDADKLYSLSLLSDDKNFDSLSAAAPSNREDFIKVAQYNNDFCFQNGSISFAIKKGSNAIGIVNADTIDNRNLNLMIGITIFDKNQRGKGYGREALELFIDFIFLELNMHRVYLGCFAFNDISTKLYEKIGFHFEGINRAFIYRNGNYYDENVFGILKEEWLALRKYLNINLHS